MNYFILKKHYFKKKYFQRKVPQERDSNFFFNNNLYKILLKTRKFFSKVLFNNKYKRQQELTKYFLSRAKFNVFDSTNNMVVLILLRAQFFLHIKDILFFIVYGFIKINGITVNKCGIKINVNSVLQLIITPNYYLYYKNMKNFFKKKLIENKKIKKLFFFKILKKKGAFIKKKIRKFFNYLFFYKLNIPK